ncbi:MAG TPA: SDR family oxidoreductase [Nitrospiraceae bacterium]|nr:SDR family oxidoreductase [Nitrospiraceae bacterium]
MAIITGASRGIGRATAELFAREGARLVICSRTRRELTRAVTTIKARGGDVAYRVMDIGSARHARSLVDMALRRYGKLDILINNAGMLGPRVPIIDYPSVEWNEVLRVNLHGVFYLSQHAARCMAPQQSGCIITLSSSVGRVGRGSWGAYAVSKFGVEGLTQVMADELRACGICTVTFNPGGTRTKMRADAYPSENPTHLRDPAEVAQALLRIVLAASPSLSGRALDFDHVP